MMTRVSFSVEAATNDGLIEEAHQVCRGFYGSNRYRIEHIEVQESDRVRAPGGRTVGRTFSGDVEAIGRSDISERGEELGER